MTREELLTTHIDDVSEDMYYELKRVIDNLPKPLEGLGRLEDLICRIACAKHSEEPDISKKALIIMCADNGIIEEGVTDMGGYMTGVVARRMAAGSAVVNKMAEIANVDVIPVDVGINGDIEYDGIINKKITKGTNNFLKDPAMSEGEVLAAIEAGIDIVKDLKDKGYGIICTGDMGIGNTTTAVAVICAILDGDPSALTGKSAGLSNTGYNKKVDVIFDGLKKYGYDRDDVGYGDMSSYGGNDKLSHESDRIVDMVTNLGGLDIAGLIGVFIGGAKYHIPVVIDGIISAAAALAADGIVPGCRQYMIGSHFGKEPATEIVLTELEINTVISAEMSMGEGVGSVMLMPMIDMVMNAFTSLKREVMVEE